MQLEFFSPGAERGDGGGDRKPHLPQGDVRRVQALPVEGPQATGRQGARDVGEVPEEQGRRYVPNIRGS